jgi:Domain of unknown function (DUF4375)
MEASRRWCREHREQDKTDPARIYWRALVERVYKTETGFEGLSEPEKKYFAVCYLEGEVYNGGFDQFFSNSSGDYFKYALAGLEDIGAERALELLRRAKQVLFDFGDVSSDTEMRRALMCKNSSRSRDSRAEELDELYWKDPDSLGDRLEKYARAHKLF